MNLILICFLSYLIGSVPFALVIGKGLYHTDVRQYGSKNLGASNTGRVLGMMAGAAVMILDAAKAFLATFLAIHFSENAASLPLAGLAAALGHCYPIFAKFKGGKAVATLYGFLFGLFVFGGYSPLFFFLPLTVFLTVLAVTKIISLSSMISAAAAAVIIGFRSDNLFLTVVLICFTLLIVFRHRENIRRILRREENKITWL